MDEQERDAWGRQLNEARRERERLEAQVARLTEERDDARQDVESYRSEVFDLTAEVARLTEERAHYRQMADEKGQIIFDIVLTREAAEARVLQLQRPYAANPSVAMPQGWGDKGENGIYEWVSSHADERLVRAALNACIREAREMLAAVPVVPDEHDEMLKLGFTGVYGFVRCENCGHNFKIDTRPSELQTKIVDEARAVPVVPDPPRDDSRDCPICDGGQGLPCNSHFL